uniref:non-specific serine/threonine protein kinase n=1 Tax=Salix viminalis TaxID=40686 RepID=A0A6N2L138_SALVM
MPIYDFYILRYSNRSSFGVLDEESILYTWNTEIASDVNLFSQALGTLTGGLRTAAASVCDRKSNSGNHYNIFGLVQCMPDLSAQQCDCQLLIIRMGKWNDGRTLNLIDPILKKVVSRSAILIRCFHIGLLCVQEMLLLSLLYILLFHPSLSAAQPNFNNYNCNSNNASNYTTSSTYQRNLNSLLSSMASDAQIDYGFYNLSVGEFPDRVNAFALCRGDVAVDVCRSCVNDSTHKILQVCPNKMEAFGVYELCMIRYSNRSIFGVVDEKPSIYRANRKNVLDETVFNEALQTLFARLQAKAASGNSLKKFASGNQSAGLETVYAIVQCTPDLSEGQCSGCLLELFRLIPNCCDGNVKGKIGVRLITPSCNLRWEIGKFFNGTLEILSPPSLPAPSQGKKNSTAVRTIVIIVIPAVGVMILVICICLFIRTRKGREKEGVENMDEIESAESLQFAFSTIRDATEDFSEKNMLGQGGFGAVYKGVLPSGQEIAVKRLSKDSGQGDLEFKNEVLLVAKLQHRNLVRLLGFCLQGIERLLIYEFVPNASLDHFIFDPTKRVQLNWERRYKIIGGIARGLLYLHEDSRLRIIHRDLKASNILLDEEMNPKISDFGMASGYMAPEYAMQGHFSVKSDVFSFGVLVLEIVTGKKNSFRNGDDIEHLMSHAWKNWREGTAQNIIDPVLSNGSATEMMRCIHIGLLCVQENVADRPTMASVVLMLSSSSLTLQIPSQPAFFMGNNTYQSDMSSSLGITQGKWNEGTPLDIIDPTMNDDPRSEIMRCIHSEFRKKKPLDQLWLNTVPMDSSKPVLLLSLLYILLFQPSLSAAQPNFNRYNCNYNNVNNDTTSSTYQRNLKSLLSSLASDTQIDYGFYNQSVGEFPDRVNAIALCRGDIAVDVCRSCVNDSTRKIVEVCPNRMDVIGVYEFCMIRYSNRSIFGVVDDQRYLFTTNSNYVFDETVFNQSLQTLFARLQARAASESSLKKFASGNQGAGDETVYAIVQCTPDLSEGQCSTCLLKLSSMIRTCCNGEIKGRIGARLSVPSCNLRWELRKIFNGTLEILPPPPPPPQILSPTSPPEPSQGMKSNTSTRIIVITVILAVGLMVLVICICLFIRKRMQREKERVEIEDEIESAESLQFTLSTIRVATEDFSEKNMLGQGGFGVVYKGVLPSGQEIAVKRLSKDSGQGDLEFKNEVLLVAKLQHRNLVRLLGFCLQGIERLLIYEFMPNASLDHFIFDPTKRVQLNWERRYKIIGGIARGLLYLHEDSRLRIIHRDLKASNILLDEEMNPKISDFGMASGYMAPEYALQGQFSVKLDVFSFGVLALEIVTGKKNSFRNGDDIEHLISLAWRNWREGTAQDIIDPVLSSSSATEMMRCIHIGLLCVQENANNGFSSSYAKQLFPCITNTFSTCIFMSRTYQSDMSSSLGQNSRVTDQSSLSESERIPLSRNEVSISELYPR